ncbi:MAG TPA: DoxX family protein [Chryseolinea sp.]|nr:DoxX family protein [Chryseolinea sp.]HPM31192.1 DoxX family protein [Chryseolinea sp.]
MTYEQLITSIINTKPATLRSTVSSISTGCWFYLACYGSNGMAWLGAPGSGSVAWGSWDNFVTYTNTLVPFLDRALTNISAILATGAEIVFGICLIIGFKIRVVALCSSILTMIFALCMAIFISPDAPLNYPVFVFSAAHLLLATISSYRWSIDFSMEKNQK